MSTWQKNHNSTKAEKIYEGTPALISSLYSYVLNRRESLERIMAGGAMSRGTGITDEEFVERAQKHCEKAENHLSRAL
jgi:hypothetical protein